MIIDRKKQSHKKYPKSIDGLVLLEIVKKGNKIQGYVVVSVDIFNKNKNKSKAELKKIGWDRYNNVMDKMK